MDNVLIDFGNGVVITQSNMDKIALEIYNRQVQYWKEYLQKKEKIMDNLKEMKQYFMERDLFSSLFSEKLDDKLWDYGYNVKTDNYIVFRIEEEFYILHLPSGTMINWYKHIGRTNTCNKDLTMDEFKLFVENLCIELMEL